MADTGQLGLLPEVCDHDGKASGRLLLEPRGLRREIVCDCGHIIVFLGYEDYRLGPARGGATTRERWRRYRSMLFRVSAAG